MNSIVQLRVRGMRQFPVVLLLAMGLSILITLLITAANFASVRRSGLVIQSSLKVDERTDEARRMTPDQNNIPFAQEEVIVIDQEERTCLMRAALDCEPTRSDIEHFWKSETESDWTMMLEKTKDGVALAAAQNETWLSNQRAALASLERKVKMFDEGVDGAQMRKVAFLFLTKGSMPLSSLWEAYLSSADKRKYSIFVHSPPDFHYEEDDFFNQYQLRNSVETAWGGIGIVEAEKLLLTAALADKDNSWFILVSEACAPIRPFDLLYSLLAAAPKSFLDNKGTKVGNMKGLFNYKPQGHFDPALEPYAVVDGKEERKEDGLLFSQYRKGSQWFALQRRHAALVALDTYLFELFRERHRRPATDEHYLQVLFAILDREDEFHHYSLTYSNWWDFTGHPTEYDGNALIAAKDILARDVVWRAGERQAVLCAGPCFYFMRKISREGGETLLMSAPDILGY